MADPAGIRWIEQTGPLELKIHLTDGSSYAFTFPQPEVGPAGPAGQAGRDGSDSTVAGPRGPAGTPGRDGKDGMDGRDGTYVDSALVNTSGNLLVGMSDGNIINAGTVVGPAGATGERGLTGLRGEPGRDGNSILSGYQAPSDEQGNDGDFYIDLSSPQFDFYGPKRGGAWGPRATFLKQPPAQENMVGRSFLAGGGAGSGGGGGLPPFTVAMPANTETELTRVKAEISAVKVKITSGAFVNRWMSSTIDMAATTLAGATDFTVSAELRGTAGEPTVVFRVERLPTNDEYVVLYATSDEACNVLGRVVTTVAP